MYENQQLLGFTSKPHSITTSSHLPEGLSVVSSCGDPNVAGRSKISSSFFIGNQNTKVQILTEVLGHASYLPSLKVVANTAVPFSSERNTSKQ